MLTLWWAKPGIINSIEILAPRGTVDQELNSYSVN